MAEGKINVYGWKGVNTTKGPLQLEDNELLKAQNAQRAPDADGSLEIRGGMSKVNSVALSGSVKGLTNVPLSPITTRKFMIGINFTDQPAYSWLTSIDNFANTSTTTTPSWPDGGDSSEGRWAWANEYFGTLVQVEDLIIFPIYHDSTAVAGETLAPARLMYWDGTTERELVRVPPHPLADPTSGLQRESRIYTMIRDGANLYFVHIDTANNPTNHRGRVFRYNIEDGSLLQIGDSIGFNGAAPDEIGNGGNSVLGLCIHQGYLYLTVAPTSGGTGATGYGVYRIRPGVDVAWTFDAAIAGNEYALPMASYRGLLYVGATELTNVTAPLYVRSAAGAYSNSTTTGASTGAGAGWHAMAVFGDNLYASGVDGIGGASTSFVKKFDGTTWSTVLTIEAAVAGPRIGISMVVHNDRLYVLAHRDGISGHIYHTANGSSWTDITLTGITGLTSWFSVLTS